MSRRPISIWLAITLVSLVGLSVVASSIAIFLQMPSRLALGASPIAYVISFLRGRFSLALVILVLVALVGGRRWSRPVAIAGIGLVLSITLWNLVFPPEETPLPRFEIEPGEEAGARFGEFIFVASQIWILGRLSFGKIEQEYFLSRRRQVELGAHDGQSPDPPGI